MWKLFMVAVSHLNGRELAAALALVCLAAILVSGGNKFAGTLVGFASVLALSISIKSGRDND